MLIERAAPARRGMTLVELVVALVIAGVLLSLIASISLRQQRVYADLADATALSGQLREAAAILPIDLRAVASGAGDIRNGGALDTAIEIRATIATAIVCDTSASGVVLAPTGLGRCDICEFSHVDRGRRHGVGLFGARAARRVAPVSRGKRRERDGTPLRPARRSGRAST